MASIDCRGGLPSVELQAVFDAEKPVVLKGLVDQWPAVKIAQSSGKALLKYIKQFSVDLPLTVYTGINANEPRIGYSDDFSGYTFRRGSAPLGEVSRRLEAESEYALYVGSSSIDRWLPGFRLENNIDLGVDKPVVNFWLGNKTTVAAHNDSPDNLACCVAGHRIFTLFPPTQIHNLYLGPVDQTPSGRPISLVDFQRPDFERFPRFKEALDHAVECSLAPGDALYIPSLWWHHVKGVDSINMLVNYWWRCTPDYKGAPDLALEHAILALRGLPNSQRQAWRDMFEYYVFGDEDKAQQHMPEGVRGILDSKNDRAIRLGWLNFSKKLKS